MATYLYKPGPNDVVGEPDTRWTFPWGGRYWYSPEPLMEYREEEGRKFTYIEGENITNSEVPGAAAAVSYVYHLETDSSGNTIGPVIDPEVYFQFSYAGLEGGRRGIFQAALSCAYENVEGEDYPPKTGYFLGVEGGATGRISIIKSFEDSRTTLVESSLSSPVSVGVDYSILAKREGSSLKLKVWPTDASEPESWSIEVTDEDPLPNYGLSGIGNSSFYQNTENNLYFLGLGTEGDAAPRPATVLVDENVRPGETLTFSFGGFLSGEPTGEILFTDKLGNNLTLSGVVSEESEGEGTIAVEIPELLSEGSAQSLLFGRVRAELIAEDNFESPIVHLDYSVAPQYTTAELVEGFDTYPFENWPIGEPNVGWQIVTLTADGYFTNSAIYTSDTQGTHPAWALDLNGVIHYLTIDNTELVPFEEDTEVELTVSLSYEQDGPELTFTPEVEYTGEGSLTYAWDFGDGSTSDQQNPTHTYIENGEYEVTLVVTDGEVTDIDTGSVSITEIIEPELEATFSFNVNVNEVSFTSSVDYTGEGSLSYSWNFGDGTTSTEPNPTHTYQENGAYLVTLQVTDGELSDTEENALEITEIPDPEYYPYPPEVSLEVGETFQFVIHDEEGNEVNLPGVLWTTANNGVVSVLNGLVTALTAGETWVRVLGNDSTITVTEPEPEPENKPKTHNQYRVLGNVEKQKHWPPCYNIKNITKGIIQIDNVNLYPNQTKGIAFKSESVLRAKFLGLIEIIDLLTPEQKLQNIQQYLKLSLHTDTNVFFLPKG